jgi:hypothetical protein
MLQLFPTGHCAPSPIAVEIKKSSLLTFMPVVAHDKVGSTLEKKNPQWLFAAIQRRIGNGKS